MKLSILRFAAALAGPAVFVCALSAAVAQVCKNGVLNDVHFVTIPYSPATNTTPTSQNRPINSDVQADLASAFAAANSKFQYKLCGLDGIFIDPSGCTEPSPGNTYDPTTCNLSGGLIAGYSWGLRTYAPNPSPNKRYIALSLGLWNNKNKSNPHYKWQCQPSHTCAPPFKLFYEAVLDAVVHVPAPNSANTLSVKALPDSFEKSSAMSVLAVLAHEFGHVYWFDNFVPNAGGSFANNFCGGIFYPSAKWGNSKVGVPFSGGHRFVSFGDTSPYPGSHVPGLPGSLHSILGSGSWASALAAFSPDEDFVETFELSVLEGAGLTALQINSDRILPVATGSWLGWKLGCFSQ
ncbi:MAG TPA: hypothetical protein VGF34_12240 [Stellaceae bacterium]